MPSNFLADGQVSGLGTVHPFLTLNFFSTWIFPLHVVSSTLKRKSSSSAMDGFQRRREEEVEDHYLDFLSLLHKLGGVLFMLVSLLALR